MDQAPPELLNCPHCGASNFAVYGVCVACKRSLTAATGPGPRVRQLGLGSVMMIVAAVAIGLAPVRVAPGVSALLALILVPATSRAVLHIEGRKAEGRPMIVPEKIHAYINSVAIVGLILLAASAAFVVTCFPTGCGLLVMTNLTGPVQGLSVACLAGAVPSLYVVYRLGKRLWRRKD